MSDFGCGRNVMRLFHYRYNKVLHFTKNCITGEINKKMQNVNGSNR